MSLWGHGKLCFYPHVRVWCSSWNWPKVTSVHVERKINKIFLSQISKSNTPDYKSQFILDESLSVVCIGQCRFSFLQRTLFGTTLIPMSLPLHNLQQHCHLFRVLILVHNLKSSVFNGDLTLVNATLGQNGRILFNIFECSDCWKFSEDWLLSTDSQFKVWSVGTQILSGLHSVNHPRKFS